MKLKDAVLGNIYTLDWSYGNERWVFMPVIKDGKMTAFNHEAINKQISNIAQNNFNFLP